MTLSKQDGIISVSYTNVQHCLPDKKFTVSDMQKYANLRNLSIFIFFMKSNPNAVAFNKKVIELVLQHLPSFFCGIVWCS